MCAVMAHITATEERSNHFHGLFQHLQTNVGGGPASAHHMLVEVLAGAETESEPPLGEQLHRRGLLSDHRRVVSHGRACHVRHQRDPRRGLCGRAEHAPCVRGVPLGVQPRKEVVRSDGEVEAGAFGAHRVLDELTRTGLLGHHRVSDQHHGTLLAEPSAPNTSCPAPGHTGHLTRPLTSGPRKHETVFRRPASSHRQPAPPIGPTRGRTRLL